MTARTSDALASALPAEWSVAPDADGEPTLWFGDRAIQRRIELAAERRVGTPDERRELNALRDRLWQVLTRVLAPDETTVERLAWALVENSWPGASWEHTDEPARISARDYVECVLAALADTSAQARHTDDDAASGA